MLSKYSWKNYCRNSTYPKWFVMHPFSRLFDTSCDTK